MNKQNLDKFINESLLIEQEDAKDAGAIGYMARAFIQATLPHSKTSDAVFTRTNGQYKLSIVSHPEIGVPYGSIPRLLLCWMTTEAVKTKNPHLELGHTLSSFMAEIGMTPTGGRWGSIVRLKDQMRRLFSSSVSCLREEGHREMEMGFRIVKERDLWWDHKIPEQGVLWGSTITLSTDFFDEITKSSVPIDLRALRVLKKSPMALDIYSWITYRNSYLRKSCEIPWKALQKQFGAGYSDDNQGTKNFKKFFVKALKKVLVVYDVNIISIRGGIEIKPSKTHIHKKHRI